jgi:hypothetical protein
MIIDQYFNGKTDFELCCLRESAKFEGVRNKTRDAFNENFYSESFSYD